MSVDNIAQLVADAIEEPAVTPLGERLLLTIPETAEVLRIHPATVYRLFDRGDLQWVRVGSRRLVTRAEVDRFISANTERASA